MVSPGDLVVGDDDGVVVVPRDLVAEVLECAAFRSEMEKKWFRALREENKSTIEAVGLRNTLSKLSLRLEDEK